MRAGILTVAMALAAAAGVSSRSTSATPSSASHAGGAGGTTTGGQHITTLDDQAELSVTVYNSDLALVRDTRNLRLPGGEFDLQFMDIAATVNPATVHVRSLTEPAALGVVEQNYEYDLLEPEKLLRKYVGREVTLVRTRQFRNEEKSGLGMPMPAGVIRVYQADSQGGVQFVGEDRIGHTPKDESLNLKIGNAFDVVCERRQIDFRKIASNVYELEYEVTLRNHKSGAVSVEVNEPIGGSWQMLRSSHKWTKTDAWASQFNLPVAADGAATLKYRVRVTY